MSFILLGILNSQAAGGLGPIESVAGYVAGGLSGPLDSIEKMPFSTETFSTIATTLSSAKSQSSGFSNANVAGYVAGGNPATSVVEKITFPGEARSTLAASLSGTKRIGTGFADEGVAGYYAAGFKDDSVPTDEVEKFDFSTDSKTLLATTLSGSRVQTSTPGMQNKAVAGYVAGGKLSPASSTKLDTVDKIEFPSDTRSTLATGLSIVVNDQAGFSNNAVAGYVAGGFDSGGATTNVDKFAFPSDTRSTLATGLSVAQRSSSAFAAVNEAGYVAGGSAGTGNVDKFDFPSDTRSTLASTLVTARNSAASLQDA